MFLFCSFLIVFAMFTQSAWANDAGETPDCSMMIEKQVPYLVCKFNGATHDIRTFHSDAAGNVYGGFDSLEADITKAGERLVFAMNGGMYHRDRRPVGLYVEGGVEVAKVNTNDGPGNFHLKPNGVFYITNDGKAGVRETGAYLKAGISARFATQSGPMLLVNGTLHPRFIPGSPSLKIRNGVGVTPSGEVVFVKSDARVNFHDFALFFRDRLGARNALFLDGSISRAYVPALQRHDRGRRMGPIVGAIQKK